MNNENAIVETAATEATPAVVTKPTKPAKPSVKRAAKPAAKRAAKPSVKPTKPSAKPADASTFKLIEIAAALNIPAKRARDYARKHTSKLPKTINESGWIFSNMHKPAVRTFLQSMIAA